MIAQQSPGANSSRCRVALVNMPFYGGGRPSIQLGLLKAVLKQEGFHADTYHLNLDLAALLTPRVYELLCVQRGRMTGEWLFSIAAFGEEACSGDKAYFDEFPHEVGFILGALDKDVSYLSELRHDIIPAFVESCAKAVAWKDYDVVGFSSTFQQNVGSLALASRIKSNSKDTTIVFGGSNLDGEMGPSLLRAFPWIDHAVIGEGEISFPALLRVLACGESPIGLAGVASTELAGGAHPVTSSPRPEMNRLPAPCYDEYFERAAKLGLLHHEDYVPWIIPFESSRGCWWGQKHHCTFCGLNGTSMNYRSKAPTRLLSELESLVHKHRCTFFAASDNILDMKYIAGVFDELADSGTDYQFFYEVKSNLTREQIARLHRGGMRRIQPGIESMSTNVLKLMRKGSSMLQNIRLLKWCRYYGIGVGWNLLWGFPGEKAKDYLSQLEVLKSIGHLEPPNTAARIWLERFAPYFSDRERFPISKIRPDSSYRHIYPSHVDLEGIAYFFEYDMEDTLPDSAHTKTVEAVEEWQRRWRGGERESLFYRRAGGSLYIDDERTQGPSGTYTFEGPLAVAYDYCGETMRSAEAVGEHLRTRFADKFDLADVGNALDEFVRLRLMISENGDYLALALPLNPYWDPKGGGANV